jgi:hypothetical protein
MPLTMKTAQTFNVVLGIVLIQLLGYYIGLVHLAATERVAQQCPINPRTGLILMLNGSSRLRAPLRFYNQWLRLDRNQKPKI